MDGNACIIALFAEFVHNFADFLQRILPQAQDVFGQFGTANNRFVRSIEALAILCISQRYWQMQSRHMQRGGFGRRQCRRTVR